MLDSKKLTDEKRETLAKLIESNLDWVGWVVNVLAPQDISRHMLRRYKKKKKLECYEGAHVSLTR